MARTPPGRTREKVMGFVRSRLSIGMPPTVREVRDEFGFRAVETARQHLEALVREGRLVKHAGRARGYRLPRTDRSGIPTVQVPLLGRVQAGELTTAVEDPEDTVAVQTRLEADEMFALRVRGDSMKDAAILDGDIVLVRRQADAEDADIVVAVVGEEATVKRLRRSRGRVELLPANPAFKPIVPDPKELVLLGKVVEVRRQLE